MDDEKITGYPLTHGASVVLEEGQNVIDYAQMRAAQMEALISMLCDAEVSEELPPHAREVFFLLAQMSVEVRQLMDVVYQRGEERGRALAAKESQNGDKKAGGKVG